MDIKQLSNFMQNYYNTHKHSREPMNLFKEPQTPEEVRKNWDSFAEAVITFYKNAEIPAHIENEFKEQINGYASGNYQCKCHKCTNVFYGDKRAITCRFCAAQPTHTFESIKKKISKMLKTKTTPQ